MLKQGQRPGTFREALDGRPELLEHGRYGSALRRYLDQFDRSSLHVSVFDDLVDDPQGWRPGEEPGSLAYAAEDIERALTLVRERLERPLTLVLPAPDVP